MGTGTCLTQACVLGTLACVREGRRSVTVFQAREVFAATAPFQERGLGGRPSPACAPLPLWSVSPSR